MREFKSFSISLSILVVLLDRAMSFRQISPLQNVETFARGRGIRELKRLNRIYGVGNWRKRKGHATIELESGARVSAELHWYEAHGIGRVEWKIKRLLE